MVTAWLAKMLAPPFSRSLPAAPAASSPGSADFSSDFPEVFMEYDNNMGIHGIWFQTFQTTWRITWTYIWANYNNSQTWNVSHIWISPRILTIIPGFGHSEVVIIYPDTWTLGIFSRSVNAIGHGLVKLVEAQLPWAILSHLTQRPRGLTKKHRSAKRPINGLV